MTKYIDTDKLIAEIERRKEKWLAASRLIKKGKDKAMYAAGKSSAYTEFFSLITSLQQEQPEGGCSEKSNDLLSELDVDLDKAARNVYESWMGGTMDDVRRDMVELGEVLNARKEELPEIGLDKFTKKIKAFQGRYNHPEIVSIKGAMTFMARMFYQYPNVARQWYDSLPKATMD